jgi:hypothetical protein
MMICQEIKWPIPRNAKTLLVVAFPRRVRVFAVLIVRAQKERRKSYANGDIRPAVERLPTFSLWTRTSPTTRYYPKIKPLFINTSLSGCVELEIGQCFVKVCRGFETLFRSVHAVRPLAGAENALDPGVLALQSLHFRYPNIRKTTSAFLPVVIGVVAPSKRGLSETTTYRAN